MLPSCRCVYNIYYDVYCVYCSCYAARLNKVYVARILVLVYILSNTGIFTYRYIHVWLRFVIQSSIM